VDVVYATKTREDLALALEEVSFRLSAAYKELAEVKIQYLYVFHQGYQNSHETSVSGREQSGEIAAAGIKEDEIRLEANISSMIAERDLFMELRRGG
jgi:hypothetical protein